jgi:uncharacterized protein YacL
MSPDAFCRWLGSTPGSIALHESVYAYSVVESVHVLTLTVFIGLAATLDMRLLGWTLRRIPVSHIVKRFMPWMIAGFIAMLMSGALLFFAIPVRTYHSVFFRAKFFLLLLAGLNVWVFHANIWRRVHEWDVRVRTPRSARVAGGLSLLLWFSIIVAGRMIAYDWFDCDKPTQRGVVKWVSQCNAADMMAFGDRR